MRSLKSLLNCIGVDTGGQISVLSSAFGYTRALVPLDVAGGGTSTESLRSFMNDLEGDHVNLNVIRVGVDNFSGPEITRIDYAIFRSRQIFRTRSLGLGRVEHYSITAAQANGRDDLGSQDEARALTQEWTVDNDGLDAFVVDIISDSSFVGLSPQGGPCNKNAKGMNGLIAGEVNRGDDGFARTFAHEIGHYLGLPHNHGDDPDCPNTTAGCNNLMAQTRCANSCGGGVRAALILTSNQGNTIRNHCAVNNGC